jgi:hypothetical protein
MKYFLDTEFIEDFHKPLFGRRRHYIDLISIALVCEDGREYFAVSKDFDLKYVWNKYDTKMSLMGDVIKVYWLRENVLSPLHKQLYSKLSGDMKNMYGGLYSFNYKNLKTLISLFGRSNKQIAEDIRVFTGGVNHLTGSPIDKVLWTAIDRFTKDHPPTFYGYYADYDWVLFCSLFGHMLDLPKGYPMYCRDLQQMVEELGLNYSWIQANVPQLVKHDSLGDARWNRELYNILIEHPVFTKPSKTTDENY